MVVTASPDNGSWAAVVSIAPGSSVAAGFWTAYQPRQRADGTPAIGIMFFPAASCEILDTWDSIGLRGTGSHDYAVKDLFVPNGRSVSFRDQPARSEPLYALPSIALFGTIIAAVSLGIARHAIDILTELAGGGMTTRARGTLKQNAMLQADLGRAEALVRSGRAFLFDALGEAWRVVSSGHKLSLQQRTMLWLASTHATTASTQAVDMMFSSGGSTAVYRRGAWNAVSAISARWANTSP